MCMYIGNSPRRVKEEIGQKVSGRGYARIGFVCASGTPISGIFAGLFLPYVAKAVTARVRNA